MGKYLATTNRLLSLLPDGVTVFPGHNDPESKEWTTPRLGNRDLIDLKTALIGIRDGIATSEITFPRRYRVNSQIAILTPFSWNMEWDGQ